MQEKTIKVLRILVIVALNIFVISIILNMGKTPELDVLSKVGSRGEEVRQIQTKLKSLGYYTGKVDGIYGNLTRNAVTAFQRAKKLTVDGIAGPQTLKALGIGGTVPSASSANDVNLLARIISAESRGEPYLGQVAVGAVILNRVKHPSFPNTLAGVIYQKGAFSAVTNSQWNKPVLDSAYKAAKDALSGWDPSGGAIFFYNPKTAKDSWIRSRPVLKQIGNHVFCK